MSETSRSSHQNSEEDSVKNADKKIALAQKELDHLGLKIALLENKLSTVYALLIGSGVTIVGVVGAILLGISHFWSLNEKISEASVKVISAEARVAQASTVLADLSIRTIQNSTAAADASANIRVVQQTDAHMQEIIRFFKENLDDIGRRLNGALERISTMNQSASDVAMGIARDSVKKAIDEQQGDLQRILRRNGEIIFVKSTQDCPDQVNWRKTSGFVFVDRNFRPGLIGVSVDDGNWLARYANNPSWTGLELTVCVSTR